MGSDYRWTEQVPKLFIIDDHKLFASGLAGLLEDDLPEAAIEVYSEVETALEAANATGPDVALLDYYLPGLSGAEAIGKLREASPGTKVIVISASLSPADHQVSEAAGAVAFWQKLQILMRLLRQLPPFYEGNGPRRRNQRRQPQLLT